MVFEDSSQNQDEDLVFAIFSYILSFVCNSTLFSRIQVVLTLITIKMLFSDYSFIIHSFGLALSLFSGLYIASLQSLFRPLSH